MSRPPPTDTDEPSPATAPGAITIDARQSARLRSLHPGPLREDTPLRASGQVIGRDGEQVDLIQAGPDVSRRHAWIGQDADGHWTIRDLDSLNGVFVNGQRISSAAVDQHELQSGDVIGLGRSRAPDYEFVLAGAPNQRRLTLTGPGPWLIGRDLHLDIPIPADLSVSERHARIERHARGLRVVDLGSRNRLWQGESRCRRIFLAIGDQFMLGHHRIRWIERQDDSLVLELGSMGQAIGLKLIGGSLTARQRPGDRFVELAPGQLHVLKLQSASDSRALMKRLGLDGITDGAMLSEPWLGEQPDRQRDRVALVDPSVPLPQGLGLERWLADEALLRLGTDITSDDRKAVIRTTIEALALQEQIDTRLPDLDASARIRAHLATALLTRPGLLVVDLAQTSLGPQAWAELRDRLVVLSGAALTIVALSLEQGIELRAGEPPAANPSARSRQFRRPSVAVVGCLMARSWSAMVDRPGSLASLLLIPIVLVLVLSHWLSVRSSVIAAQTVMLISTPLAALALTITRNSVSSLLLHRFGLLPDLAIAQALSAAGVVTVQFLLVLAVTTAQLPLDVWSIHAGTQVLLGGAAGMSLGSLMRTASGRNAQVALALVTLAGTCQAVWIFKLQPGLTALLGLSLLWTGLALLLGSRRRSR